MQPRRRQAHRGRADRLWRAGITISAALQAWRTPRTLRPVPLALPRDLRIGQTVHAITGATLRPVSARQTMGPVSASTGELPTANFQRGGRRDPDRRGDQSRQLGGPLLDSAVG